MIIFFIFLLFNSFFCSNNKTEKLKIKYSNFGFEIKEDKSKKLEFFKEFFNKIFTFKKSKKLSIELNRDLKLETEKSFYELFFKVFSGKTAGLDCPYSFVICEQVYRLINNLLLNKDKNELEIKNIFLGGAGKGGPIEFLIFNLFKEDINSNLKVNIIYNDKSDDLYDSFKERVGELDRKLFKDFFSFKKSDFEEKNSLVFFPNCLHFMTENFLEKTFVNIFLQKNLSSIKKFNEIPFKDLLNLLINDEFFSSLIKDLKNPFFYSLKNDRNLLDDDNFIKNFIKSGGYKIIFKLLSENNYLKILSKKMIYELGFYENIKNEFYDFKKKYNLKKFILEIPNNFNIEKNGAVFISFLNFNIRTDIENEKNNLYELFFSFLKDKKGIKKEFCDYFENGLLNSKSLFDINMMDDLIKNYKTITIFYPNDSSYFFKKFIELDINYVKNKDYKEKIFNNLTEDFFNFLFIKELNWDRKKFIKNLIGESGLLEDLFKLSYKPAFNSKFFGKVYLFRVR